MSERGTTRRGGMNKTGGSVWIGRGEGYSAVVTPLEDIPGGSEAAEI